MLLSVSCMSTCNVLAFLLRRLKQDKSSLLGNNLVLVPLEFNLSNTMLSLCFLRFLVQVVLLKSILVQQYRVSMASLP